MLGIPKQLYWAFSNFIIFASIVIYVNYENSIVLYYYFGKIVLYFCFLCVILVVLSFLFKMQIAKKLSTLVLSVFILVISLSMLNFFPVRLSILHNEYFSQINNLPKNGRRFKEWLWIETIQGNIYLTYDETDGLSPNTRKNSCTNVDEQISGHFWLRDEICR